MKYFPALIIAFFYLSVNPLQAQTTLPDTVLPVSLISVKYGGYVPAGILAERFGYISSVGPAYYFKTSNNYIFGAEAGFLFGSKVKEDVLKEISASNGLIINFGGEYELMQLQQRGFYLTANAGKLFPVIGPNQNSGIAAMAGAGFVQHKIHFNYHNTLPQLAGDYEKGYDRLTNGILLTETIGYLHLDNKKLVNFFTGISLMQGFTQNRRSWNFDTIERDDRQRLDLFLGAQLTWFFPVYHTTTAKDYYYY